MAEALFNTNRAAMISVVSVIAVMPDIAELWIWLVVLLRGKDLVQHIYIGRDIQWNLVDVPVVQQADTGGALVHQL
jgi:hypothetical protein